MDIFFITFNLTLSIVERPKQFAHFLLNVLLWSDRTCDTTSSNVNCFIKQNPYLLKEKYTDM